MWVLQERIVQMSRSLSALDESSLDVESAVGKPSPGSEPSTSGGSAKGHCWVLIWNGWKFFVLKNIQKKFKMKWILWKCCFPEAFMAYWTLGLVVKVFLEMVRSPSLPNLTNIDLGKDPTATIKKKPRRFSVSTVTASSSNPDIYRCVSPRFKVSVIFKI